MSQNSSNWLSRAWSSVCNIVFRRASGAPSATYCRAPVRILGGLVLLFGAALCVVAVYALFFGEKRLADRQEYLWGGLVIGVGLMMLFQEWSARMEALVDEGADELRRQTDEMERDNARRLAALEENARKFSELERSSPSAGAGTGNPPNPTGSQTVDQLVANQREADLNILSEQVSSQANFYGERQTRLKEKRAALNNYEKEILRRDAEGETAAVWGALVFAIAAFLGAFLYPMAWTSSGEEWACRMQGSVSWELLAVIVVASLIAAAAATKNVRGARSYRALCVSAFASLICFAGAAVGAFVFSACQFGGGDEQTLTGAALLGALAAIAAPFAASMYIAAARPRAED